MSIVKGMWASCVSPYQCAISGSEKAVTPSTLKALPREPAGRKWSNVQCGCTHMIRWLLEDYYILLNLAESQTLHKDLVSVGDFSKHICRKIGQKGTIAHYLHPGFYLICCFFTWERNIKTIVEVYFCCFTHVCSQKHDLIHLRPDTIHTSKGCKNLNPNRWKIEKTQLSHVPVGENKHIFSWNAPWDTCSVLSGLAFSTWPSSSRYNIISR